MNDLSKLIAGLSPDKLGELHERLNRKRVPTMRVSIPAQPRTSNTFPLSFGQQRYWFLSRLDPESAAYNVPTTVRLKGKLDVAALERSINEVVRRHESLRTNFNLVDDQLVQIIAPELLLSLPITSLDHLPENERVTEVERLGLIEAQAPFDLTRDALLRAKLLRVQVDEHVLLITTHHIVCDKWSHGVFMQELAGIYAATVLGQRASLPALSVQPADVACWQRDWLQGAVLEEQLAYWTTRLGGLASSLDLPTDRPRTQPQLFRAGRIPFVIERELLAALKSFGQRHDVTLFMILMAAFKALLQRVTEQDKIAVSFLSANRNRSEVVNLIGQFANTLLLNTEVTPEHIFHTLLATIRETTLGAYAHQDFPFERLVEELQPAREAGRVPLFQVAFNLQKAPPVDLRLPEIILTPFEIYRGPAGLDLYLEMEERDEELAGAWEYNAELFDGETAQSLLREYTRLIEFFIAGPDRKLNEFELQPDLARRLAANRARDRKQTIAVAATFTAEPLEDALAFWMDVLEFPAEVRFASYNQVFQELLDPSSLLSTNRDGVNVLLVRFEDWQRFAPVPGRLLSAAAMERGVRELADALKSAATRAAAPFLLLVCPASPEVESAAENRELLARMETLLETELAAVRGIYCVSSVELKSAYGVAQRDDRQADSIGHIPYNEKFFAALGTVVARKIRALRHAPYKVVVLDCDQTLWRGVCAEDGALGVVIDDGCREFQEFMLAQHRAGMLVCLCSRNEEADVFEVFAKHRDMILRREHIAASRINWEPKSDNLRALAAELNLDLGSFVFIDDDPVICAEVEANCPEVLTINHATASGRLDHIWAFDRLQVTAEDRKRTDFYQQTVERERLRRSVTTFADFLAGLELEVEVFPLATTHLARVAQLLERTTQFNTTGLRRTEVELQHAEGFVVKVRDRFGDYGTVGAAIFRAVADALVVESFILSCRALGRGVEHRMLGELSAVAASRGLRSVDVSFVRTNRNRPAEEFLTRYGQQYRTETELGTVFRFPADAAARVAESPVAACESAVGVVTPSSGTGYRQSATGNVLRRINAEFSALEQILQGLEQHKRRSSKAKEEAYVAPCTPVEEIVAEIWARMLGVEKVGVHSNFFQLGGHSVLATMLVAKLSETFAMDLTLRAFFEWPTVAAIAQLIEQYQIEHSDATMLSELDGLSDEEVKALLASEAQLMREQLSEA